jgi:hypothetical protein
MLEDLTSSPNSSQQEDTHPLHPGQLLPPFPLDSTSKQVSPFKKERNPRPIKPPTVILPSSHSSLQEASTPVTKTLPKEVSLSTPTVLLGARPLLPELVSGRTISPVPRSSLLDTLSSSKKDSSGTWVESCPGFMEVRMRTLLGVVPVGDRRIGINVSV